MPPTCQPPWHYLRHRGTIVWFRRLTPFATHQHHYRFGPLPADEHTLRIYGFGEHDQPWTCEGCGRVIDRPEDA